MSATLPPHAPTPPRPAAGPAAACVRAASATVPPHPAHAPTPHLSPLPGLLRASDR